MLGIIFSSPVIRATLSEPTFETHLSYTSLANNRNGNQKYHYQTPTFSIAINVFPVFVGRVKQQFYLRSFP